MEKRANQTLAENRRSREAARR